MQPQWYERRLARKPSLTDTRTELEVDYARVVHSASFRRLAGKTQIHQGESDLPRNRLTHSIEVSQIALGIFQRLSRGAHVERFPDFGQLLQDQAIWQIAGLCHDLGHSAGAHAGEDALNSLVPFEGNGQTLRILTKLESHSAGFGLNLTRRSLLSVLKYQRSYSEALRNPVPAPHRGISGIPMIGPEHTPPKCYLDEERSEVEWCWDTGTIDADLVRKMQLKTFDCSVLDLADDISYSIADMDDAIAMGMMKREWIEKEIPSEAWEDFIIFCRANSERTYHSTGEVLDQLFAGGASRKRMTGAIVNYFLSAIQVRQEDLMADPLYRFWAELQDAAAQLMQFVKACVFKHVIEAPSVQRDRVRLQRQIVELFDALSYQPQLYLPLKYRELWADAEDGNRIIADYISGMTDRFLENTHRDILS
jgi:dGTPase